jgi:WhiB family redox-sensing transcriptional regulator
VIVRFKNKAACEGTETESWFPEHYNPEEEKYLKRICNGCEAKSECLVYALEYEVTGIWGGTNAADRRRIRKTKGLIAKPVLPEWERKRA